MPMLGIFFSSSGVVQLPDAVRYQFLFFFIPATSHVIKLKDPSGSSLAIHADTLAASSKDPR